MDDQPSVPLDEGLDLRRLVTSSSLLNINLDYDETDSFVPQEEDDSKTIDVIGSPVKSFESLEKELNPVDDEGYVKKKILEEGGGLPLHNGCTVSISFSGYWENELDPFDIRPPSKPLVVDLKDNGLLPGVLIAVKSMLVGELSVFLLSYEVAYGELGMPPRVKPKAKCVFYIRLMKSILTPPEGPLDLSEPNTFARVYHEVKILYTSGVTLHKSKNIGAAIQLFKKGVNMLHKCRLANENEEDRQKKLLVKLYTNLAICYNVNKQPLKACTACNELHRLDSLWNNSKVLFQNAKALRMIGQFNEALRKIQKAIKLSPDNKELRAEYALLEKTKENYDLKWLVPDTTHSKDLITDNFKREVDNLIKNFKENINLCKLTLPPGINSTEMEYIREVCIRENLFFNKIQANYLLDKEEDKYLIHEEKDILNYM